MHALTADAVRDERVVHLARVIVAHLPRRDHLAEAEAVLRWVQGSVRYVRDPWHPGGLERLQHPAHTLFESRQGDCDDLAMVHAALLAALGAPWAFRTVGSDPLFPRRFRHVYALTLIGDRWVPADPTFEHPLGWEPPFDDPTVRPFEFRLSAVTSRQDWLP